MLRFKRVSAKNYLSITDVSIDLDNRGLVLIEGINDTNETFQSNGAGKSTLLSTVTYALYGVTPNGLKADAVINNQVGKGMSIILEFEKDGVPYRIERYRKHGKYKNTVKLFQGENNLTQKSVADTDKKIQDIFGIDYLTYMNSIMYGQGDVEIFATATDKGKKQILENLADIGVYRYAQEVAKAKAKEAVAKQEEYRRQVDLKEQQVILKQQAFEEVTANYENTKVAIKGQEDSLKKAKGDLAIREASLKLTKEKTDQQLSDVHMALQQTTSFEIPPELVASSQELTNNVYKLEQVLATVNAELIKASSEYEDVANADEATCYVCGAPLSVEHKQKELARLSQLIRDKDTYIKQVDNALPMYRAKLEEVNSQLQVEQSKQGQAMTYYQSLVDEKTKIEQAYNQVANEVASLQQRVTDLEATLNSLKAIPEPAYDSKGEQALKDEIEALKENMNTAKKEAEQFTILAEEVFSNKGIRSDVLDLVTPFLNERANEYLAILSGSDIEIKFSTQTETASGELRDKFDLEVLNGSGGETYQSNSEGEKKRIDLAISFAIQDLVQSKANIAVNLGLYDECFDGLDSVGCENVIKILKDRQKNVSSIFVITHNENLKPLFENVVTIKKEQGNSVLLEAKER